MVELYTAHTPLVLDSDLWQFHTPCPFNPGSRQAAVDSSFLAARVAEGLLGATGLFEGGLASLGVVEVDVPSEEQRSEGWNPPIQNHPAPIARAGNGPDL